MEIGGKGAARESDITAKAIARLKRRMRGVFSLVRLWWVGLRTATETETGLVVCEGIRSLLCHLYIYVCEWIMIELALEPRSQMSENDLVDLLWVPLSLLLRSSPANCSTGTICIASRTLVQYLWSGVRLDIYT